MCADELTANECEYRRSTLSPSLTPSVLEQRILSRKRETSFLRFLFLQNKIQKDTEEIMYHNQVGLIPEIQDYSIYENQ